MKSKTKKIIIVAALLLVVANFANAGLVNCGLRTADGGITEHCQIGDLFNLVIMVVNYLLGFATMVAVVYVLWGGFQMVISPANPDKVKDGKTTLINAITGLAITLGAYLLINIGIQLLVGEDVSLSNFFDLWNTD